jgi:peptide deformylase
MKIVTYLEALRKPCAEVTEKINVEALSFMMINELKEQFGAGLAANQLGIQLRICVIAVLTMIPITLVNPVIVKEQKLRKVQERCLSLPGIEVEIERPMYLKVRAIDEHRNRVKHTFTGTQAQVVKHEVDHLNGILMIDYLDADKKAAIESKLAKGA